MEGGGSGAEDANGGGDSGGVGSVSNVNTEELQALVESLLGDEVSSLHGGIDGRNAVADASGGGDGGVGGGSGVDLPRTLSPLPRTLPPDYLLSNLSTLPTDPQWRLQYVHGLPPVHTFQGSVTVGGGGKSVAIGTSRGGGGGICGGSGVAEERSMKKRKLSGRGSSSNIVNSLKEVLEDFTKWMKALEEQRMEREE